MRIASLLAAATVIIVWTLYYFLMFFLGYVFLEKAVHCKSAMIIVFFIVNTLPNAGSVIIVYILEKHIVSIFYNPLTLSMMMWSDLAGIF